MSTKSLYAVEVKMTVYVFAEHAKRAEEATRESLAAAMFQAKDSATLDATLAVPTKVPSERWWDKPVGSDRKLVRELMIG